MNKDSTGIESIDAAKERSGRFEEGYDNQHYVTYPVDSYVELPDEPIDAILEDLSKVKGIHRVIRVGHTETSEGLEWCEEPSGIMWGVIVERIKELEKLGVDVKVVMARDGGFELIVRTHNIEVGL